MAHPACCLVWIARRRGSAATLGCALVVGACSAPPEPTERQVAVVAAGSAIVRAAPAIAPPLIVASPTPAPAPRRAFVDPPLPPELVDPPGLLPLPPSPRVADPDQTQEGTRP